MNLDPDNCSGDQERKLRQMCGSSRVQVLHEITFRNFNQLDHIFLNIMNYSCLLLTPSVIFFADLERLDKFLSENVYFFHTSMYTLEIIEVLWRVPSSRPGQNTVKIPKTANML